jgi:hypothetical protein
MMIPRMESCISLFLEFEPTDYGQANEAYSEQKHVLRPGS